MIDFTEYNFFFQKVLSLFSIPFSSKSFGFLLTTQNEFSNKESNARGSKQNTGRIIVSEMENRFSKISELAVRSLRDTRTQPPVWNRWSIFLKEIGLKPRNYFQDSESILQK